LTEATLPISFRPLTMDDLPLIHRWLGEPHVRQWWRDGGETLAQVSAKYAPRIAGAEPTRCFVIEYGGGPVGYIQTYRMRDYPDYNRHVGASDDRAGIDLFIGERNLVGRGIGTRVLTSFLRSVVFADPSIGACALGPEPGNRRAIRAYEKAGFQHWKTVNVPGEPQPEYVMIVSRGDLERH